jgi:hypothetical protein
MVWPFKSRSRKSIARIEVVGAIATSMRKQVLEALEEVREKNSQPCCCALTARAAPWVTPKKFTRP